MTVSRNTRQDEGIELWKKAKGKATCLYPTGFGKTRVALKTISRLKALKKDIQVVVIVPTDNLKEQWTLLLIEWELIANTTVYVVNTAIKRDLSCDLLIVDRLCSH